MALVDIAIPMKISPVILVPMMKTRYTISLKTCMAEAAGFYAVTISITAEMWSRKAWKRV